MCQLCIAIVVPVFVLELLKWCWVLKVLWLFCISNLLAGSEEVKAMTRDDFVPSIGSDHGAFVFDCCCGTVLHVSMGELCVYAEQSWLQLW